jgi:hypothetical protein
MKISGRLLSVLSIILLLSGCQNKPTIKEVDINELKAKNIEVSDVLNGNSQSLPPTEGDIDHITAGTIAIEQIQNKFGVAIENCKALAEYRRFSDSEDGSYLVTIKSESEDKTLYYCLLNAVTGEVFDTGEGEYSAE